MENLKPNKSNTSNVQCDEYTVRTWLLQIKQCSALAQVWNNSKIDEPRIIRISAIFFSVIVGELWFTRVDASSVYVTYDAF